MFGALVRTSTSDHAALEGLLFEPESINTDLLVLHIHGSLGNFYENPFVDYFAQFYTRRGVGFLPVNTRGHDVGGITERFDNCIADIEAWLRFAWARGYERVLLQGHSLGALKMTRFASATRISDPKIVGLILLAPFDLIAFYCRNDEATRLERLEGARHVATQDANAIMPTDFWNMWPISAGTFIDLVGDDTQADVFPFRKGTTKGTILEDIQLPTFAAIGGDDFAAYPSPGSCIAQLQAIPTVTAVLVEQAPHNFAGHEEDLIQSLAPWLGRVNN